MSNLEIKKLSDREHILARPSMYIGSVSCEESEEFIFDGNRMVSKTVKYSPGLVKIINEVIDNGVDIHHKTGYGKKIEVEISEDTVTVKDDGVGFPVQVNDVCPVELALGHARAGSNFNDDENVGQIGTNGVGAFATNCFSLRFECETTRKIPKGSSYQKTLAVWENNASKFANKVSKLHNESTGTVIRFNPDLKRFGMKEITKDVMDVVHTRLVCLAKTFPSVKFYFNGSQIKPEANIAKWFIGEGGEVEPVIQSFENFEIAIIPHNEKVNSFTFMNGLYLKDGGTHLDYLMNEIHKVFASMKTMKVTKTDVGNTLQIVMFGKGFRNMRFNSQTKEKMTNSVKEVSDYLGDIEKLLNKVRKNKSIKEFLKAAASAREHRLERSKLNAAKKQKIKSDKFLDAQVSRKYLMLVEGDSALGGLAPALGRKEIAYYALKGKPLNAFSSTAQKVAANKELSELLSIIHNSDLERIIIGTDQDLDGFHIRGLLLGFIYRYAPELADRVYILQTPVRGVMNNKGELVKWVFGLNDHLGVKSSETTQYYKGLGSWDTDDLKKVIKTEGLEKLLIKVSLSKTDENTLEAWLGNDSTKRKIAIKANDFNIALI